MLQCCDDFYLQTCGSAEVGSGDGDFYPPPVCKTAGGIGMDGVRRVRRVRVRRRVRRRDL
jgi:hypothetical protein